MFWKIFLVIALIGSLSVSIRATANDVGCTYTQGHWKTHSVYGPGQPADDGWFTTFGPYPPGPGGPDAPLFDSGLTWIEALNTPSRGGNAWFILASQWMAAYLNYYNGAGSGGTDVLTTMKVISDPERASNARASMGSRTIRLISIPQSRLQYPAPQTAHPILNLGV
jgi:hypothetical protein